MQILIHGVWGGPKVSVSEDSQVILTDSTECPAPWTTALRVKGLEVVMSAHRTSYPALNPSLHVNVVVHCPL